MVVTSQLIRTPTEVSNIIGDNIYIDPYKFPLKRIVNLTVSINAKYCR